MKLKNGDEIEVGGQKYRVLGDEIEVGGQKYRVLGGEIEVGGQKYRVLGDEIEVGGQKYRVLGDELHEINKGSPPAKLMPEFVPREAPLDQPLIDFYLKKGYDVCPNCGGDKNQRGGAGCGQYHYGTYCLSPS